MSASTPRLRPRTDDVEWVARWVWYEQERIKGYDHAYFRRELHLDEAPVSARILVSAETRYELWCNGTRVGQGSLPSDPRWKAYDEHDLTGLVGVGGNTIAVLVEYVPLSSQRGSGNTSPPPDESKNTDLYNNILPIAKGDVAPAGLLVQVEVEAAGGSTKRWGTDPSWRVRQAKAWWHEAPRHADTVYQEIYDATVEPVGWHEPGFDDGDWAAARIVPDAAAPGGGLPRGGHTGIWRLAPRDLPPERSTVLTPAAVVATGEVVAMHGNWDKELVAERLSMEVLRPLERAGIDGLADLVGGVGPAVFEGSDPLEDWDTFDGIREPVVVLDFGDVINARLEIDVEGEEGAFVEIGYASHLEGDGLIPGVSRRSRHADRYELREGRQVWRTFGWRSFRYVKIVGRHLSRPLTVHAVRAERLDYGQEVVGRFACSDDALTRLWDPSVRTTQLCGLDQVMDNPSRERKQWSGDIAPMVLGCQATYGPTALIRRYLRSFYRMQSPSGHFPKIAPWLMSLRAEHDIFDHGLWLVIRTNDWYALTGDLELLAEVAPGVRRFLEYCERFEANDGTLEGAPFHLYVDWSPIDLRGASLVVNALYLLALQAGATVAATVGDSATTEVLQAKADRLRSGLRDRFWDKDRSVFVDAILDGEHSEAASEHALGLALLTGVATDEQAEQAIAAWQGGAVDLTIAQPPAVFLLAEGLTRHGRPDLALAFVARRFGRFLDAGFTTFGELWHLWANQGSARSFAGSTGPSDATEAPTRRWYPREARAVAQGAAAWPGHFLHTRALGVAALDPGYTRFSVAPDPATGLTWAEGTVMTPHGPIEARWELDGDRLVATVAHPDACTPELLVPAGWRDATGDADRPGIWTLERD